MDLLKGLDLFSGVGGISMAISEFVRTMAYCEIEPYCQGVLLSRMADGILDNAPIWDDIKTLDGRQFEGKVDIIFGGFPCTDISIAGVGRGLEGERSGLFFEIMRLADEIKPSYIFLENVPMVCSRGGLQIVREITERGYDCRWCTLSAAEVGAKHKRERFFLLAHSNNYGQSPCENWRSFRKCFISREESDKQKESIRKAERTSALSGDVANSQGKRCEERRQSSGEKTTYSRSESVNKHPFRDNWETDEPEMAGVVDGLQFRSHRIKSLGNSVVPFQVREAFRLLSGVKEKELSR